MFKSCMYMSIANGVGLSHEANIELKRKPGSVNSAVGRRSLCAQEFTGDFLIAWSPS